MLRWPSRKTIVIGTGGVLLIVALFSELKWHPVDNWLGVLGMPHTGMNEYTTKQTKEKNPKGEITTTEEIQTGKTGWDYLQLAGTVAVPLVLGIGGFWLNQQEQRRAEENLREEALQTYLGYISELLLNHNLGDPSQRNTPAQNIARARTLTVLERLGEDGERKGAILRFLSETKLLLSETKLLNRLKPVVYLRGANLRGAHLRKADLSNAHLRGVDLIEADLSSADLSNAYLHRSDLIEANLRGAHLSSADLSKADLRGADLSEADLIGADLSRADLRGADLRRAKLGGADMRGAKLGWAKLDGANLSGARLIGAELGKAKLGKAKLGGADLRKAHYDDATQFPDGFDPVKKGMQKIDQAP